MKEAIDNDVSSPEYHCSPDNVLLKEYSLLVNYNMWELGKCLRDYDNGDGLVSLSP
tara:strand:+ start:402 stop:569 length:168 start_codon:yes stop_codon:yes gene_type:complete